MPADAVRRQQPEREQHPLPQVCDGEDVLETVLQHKDTRARLPSRATLRATVRLLHPRTSVVPPAAAIFSAALPLNLCARTVSAFAMSPRARILIGPLRPTSPRSRSNSGVTSTPASK